MKTKPFLAPGCYKISERCNRAGRLVSSCPDGTAPAGPPAKLEVSCSSLSFRGQQSEITGCKQGETVTGPA